MPLPELITDRTAEDYARALELSAIRWQDMTPEQQAEWQTSLKGAYNASDLNRVTEAMEYLVDRLRSSGYSVDYTPIMIRHGPEVVQLPDGYTELSYIQANGNQYIDTGVQAPSGFRAVLDLQFDFLPETLSGIIGAHNPSAPYGRNLLSANNSQYEIGQGDGFYDFGTPILGRMLHVDISNTLDNLHCLIDGVRQTMTPSVPGTGAFTGSALYLCAINGGQAWYQNLHGRLGRVFLYIGGVLVRNYVPCADPSGNIGMYDMVNRKFYGSGSGLPFISGPVKNARLPYGYSELEYIESTGTQFIDTGVSYDAENYNQLRLAFRNLYPSFGGPYWLVNGCSGSGCIFYAGCATSGDVVYGRGSDVIAGLLAETNVDYTWDYDALHGTLILNGNRVATGILQEKPSGTSTITIFGYRTSPSGVDCHTERLMAFRVFQAETMLRDFVPARSKAGSVGLFDTVQNQFYECSGAGALVAGPVVEYPSIQPPIGTTWYESDIPTASQLAQYLANVKAIRETIENQSPEPPADMANLTYEEANDIERILLAMDAFITNMIDAYFYSNEIICGEV